jgi:hypothetical protein
MELKLTSRSESASKLASIGVKGKNKSSSPRKYKIIRAPSLDRLEVIVNTFLESDESSQWTYLQGPQVFGHEEYIQTFIKG